MLSFLFHILHHVLLVVAFSLPIKNEFQNFNSSFFVFLDDMRWETVTRTTGGSMQEFTVSYQTLLPSTVYSFRVIAYNTYGISYPVYSKDPILTPSKLYLEYGYLQHKPFYRQQWFMVSLAATSIIIIIMIVAVLCVKSKSYKYKRKQMFFFFMNFSVEYFH